MSRGRKGSHPPTLLRLVARALDDECRLAVGQRVLLAVSGGGDSTALLHVMARLAEPRGLSLFAHGVDHGLRPEAGRELDLAEGLSLRLGVPFSRGAVVLSPGGNMQARARQARYAELRRRAAELGGALVATAHHADDRAETVLLRILRGVGLDGLGVLAAHDGDLVRPFLRARRSDVLSHLARHQLAYANDPSNRNPKYSRVRVRTEVLPLLESMNPRIVEHLCALADEAHARRMGNGATRVALGREQTEQLSRALERRQSGFSLPLSRDLRLVLEASRR
ncbi:MAG: tRNA lysidine(34) synthetase TilS [Polyangiaceae bacterium]